MNQVIIQICILAVQLLPAVLVWQYYRKKNYSISQKYSTFGPRFWTGWVDGCVLWPISFVVSILIALELPSTIGAILFSTQYLACWFYTVIMHAKYGQTFGKMVCKIKVVDFGTEGAISIRQACLREGIPIAVSLGILGYQIYAISTGGLSLDAIAKGQMPKDRAYLVLAKLPILWGVAEAVTMLSNKKRRALHDYIAGTVVVRTNATE
jgi:uncharacterized RDD family membrane protein YckC